MKNVNDICLVVQSRLNSERVPGKMLRPFCGSTLVDILFEKLKKVKNFPFKNVRFSVFEDELKQLGASHGVEIFHRSEQSANEDHDLKVIYEWHDAVLRSSLDPFKYVIIVSACNPLLKIETIESFVDCFVNSEREGAFSVFEKKNYYWDENHKPITDWKGASIMNTKGVETVYEGGHCLYASRLDIINDGFWMDTKSPPEPELFVMDELEAFDIDHEWQFKMGELLYDNLR